MTKRLSLVRRAALVAAIPFVASLPACEMFIRKPATETQPAEPAPAEVWAKAAEQTLPPPFGLIASTVIGSGVVIATALASAKSKKEQQ